MTVYKSYQYYPLISDINYIFNSFLKMLKLKSGLKKRVLIYGNYYTVTSVHNMKMWKSFCQK